MLDFVLRNKLKELCNSASTLLWLEGTKHQPVVSVKLSRKRLVLQLADSTCRVVAFDRYAVTSVGLQFWSQGRPGVLYKWDQVPRTGLSTTSSDHPGDEPPTPPNMAA